MKALDLSRDEPTIRYEIEKDGHISVVFAKHPPMPVQCTDNVVDDARKSLVELLVNTDRQRC